ncbi:hypothetical protein TruAng_004704 [Truncatella angustata]|nr:hypothetical protein TruAng_004704 [Truncatella angustata]
MAAVVSSVPPAATLPSSPYPYAFAPDIIRSHQKDAYFQGVLTTQLADLHRHLLGARSAHAWTAESKTIADLLYLCLTTLIGNRTLGEEYCNVVQVEGDSGALPTLSKRAAYISSSILLPYTLSRILPRLRAKIRLRLERNLARLRMQGEKKLNSWNFKIQSYIHTHLSAITSPSPLYALSLALFYFSGSYYEIAKRMTGLRYIFTHKIDENTDRVGYEVLGVLLVLQFAVQGYLHLKSTLSSAESEQQGRERLSYSGPDVSLNEHAYSSNNALLASAAAGKAQTHLDLATATHTPILGQPRYDLADEKTMGWIKGAQQRKYENA